MPVYCDHETERQRAFVITLQENKQEEIEKSFPCNADVKCTSFVERCFTAVVCKFFPNCLFCFLLSQSIEFLLFLTSLWSLYKSVFSDLARFVNRCCMPFMCLVGWSSWNSSGTVDKRSDFWRSHEEIALKLILRCFRHCLDRSVICYDKTCYHVLDFYCEGRVSLVHPWVSTSVSSQTALSFVRHFVLWRGTVDETADTSS